jgi:hypothetical protein
VSGWIDVSRYSVSSKPARRNIRRRDETILRRWRRTPETVRRYHPVNHAAKSRIRETVDGRLIEMRPLSLIIAAGLLLAGSTMAGTVQGTLPGIGTFTYNGIPIAPVSPSVIVAAR